MDEAKIIKLMKSLNISREDAIELMEEDKRIDKGEKLYELDPELEKGAKKARQADRKPTERKPRERKENADKQILLEQLVNAVCGSPTHARDLEIVNDEREFLFTYNGIKYKVILSAPRK